MRITENEETGPSRGAKSFAPALEGSDANRYHSSTWLDAQHRHVVITQRAVERHVLRAEVAPGATATGRHTRPTLRPIPLPTDRRLASAAAEAAAAAGRAAAQGRAGREPVRP